MSGNNSIVVLISVVPKLLIIFLNAGDEKPTVNKSFMTFGGAPRCFSVVNADFYIVDQ